MTYTLLEMVQALLRSLGSDEVNSIDDTTESIAVAEIIKEVYYDLVNDVALPEHETLFQLNASGDNTKPCLMTAPSNVLQIRSIQYDKRGAGETKPDYTTLTYMDIGDFITRQQVLRNDPSNVGVMIVKHNNEDFEFIFRTDTPPQFYTTADDNQIIFDSFDSTLDTTLQKTKTVCTGRTVPPFSMVNSFVPDIHPQEFSLLLNKAKVRAFFELKEQPNTEAATETRRQKIINQKRKRTTPDVPEVKKVSSRFGRK